MTEAELRATRELMQERIKAGGASDMSIARSLLRPPIQLKNPIWRRSEGDGVAKSEEKSILELDAEMAPEWLR